MSEVIIDDKGRVSLGMLRKKSCMLLNLRLGPQPQSQISEENTKDFQVFRIASCYACRICLHHFFIAINLIEYDVCHIILCVRMGKIRIEENHLSAKPFFNNSYLRGHPYCRSVT